MKPDTDLPVDQVIEIVAAKLSGDAARTVEAVQAALDAGHDGWPDQGTPGDTGDVILGLASLAAWAIANLEEATGNRSRIVIDGAEVTAQLLPGRNNWTVS